LAELKKVIASETNTKEGKLKELDDWGKKKAEDMKKKNEERKKFLQKRIEDLKN